MADWTILVLLLPVVALPVIYLVARARQGPPPPHAADAAGKHEMPHDEEPVPRDGDGRPFVGSDETPQALRDDPARQEPGSGSSSDDPSRRDPGVHRDTSV